MLLSLDDISFSSRVGCFADMGGLQYKTIQEAANASV